VSMVLALADDNSTEEIRRVAPGYFATSPMQDRPSLEANLDPQLDYRENTPTGKQLEGPMRDLQASDHVCLSAWRSMLPAKLGVSSRLCESEAI
jgi:hypothetical protein